MKIKKYDLIGSKKIKKVRLISKYDFAWLAGFIDGDGWFTCAVWERVAQKSKRPSITIAPRIGASQIASGRSVLDFCVEITGCGSVYEKQEFSNTFNSSKQATWIVSRAEEIKFVCELILPYLVQKKRQCKIMLELINLRINLCNINRYKGEKYPLENTMKCAKLGLSLNPEAISSRNSQHNSEKRLWSYWEKRIPEVYKISDILSLEKRDEKRINLICDNCGKLFVRLKCNINKGTTHNFCSMNCNLLYKGC